MTLLGWLWDVTVCFFKGYRSFTFGWFLTVKDPELCFTMLTDQEMPCPWDEGEEGGSRKWVLWTGLRFPYRNQSKFYHCSA